ncbi:MAG: diaminopimelate epimerase [Candidatus Marinimicrobia bacterium]|nr:diaminopimelate epimerase [Candidatus Neomarinimicrobiota bacterium]
MDIRFWKMHGAANDFILVDDRAETFPWRDREWLQAVAARHTGVGCEGFILIQPPAGAADFRMRFFNPDGGEVEMCGNGARCVARLAYELGIAPVEMRFETVAGPVQAQVRDSEVTLGLTPPKDWRLAGSLALPDGQRLAYGFVNSGVPHVVVEVPDVTQVDVAGWGAAIRHHADFAPAGANANFITVTGPGALRIRTYERGVEAETPACGTGIAAAALVAGRQGRVTPPVAVTCAAGETLHVDFQLTAEGAEGVTLTGPATHVFEGVLRYAPAAGQP